MKNFSNGLYIVATPIGNLDDITFRALDVLKNSDIILCEDTRRSLKLLNHFKLKKKLVSYHKFNEQKELSKLIEYLKEGKILSLISDAGTPILSDPGLMLVKACIENNINISSIPGPSAITTAVTISGFNEKYLFFGFLPKKENELVKTLSQLKDIDFSIVFFIPAIKINFYLNFFKQFFNDRDILIAREMTKLHETFYRSKVKDVELFRQSLKGELTIVISKKNINNVSLTNEEIILEAKKYLKKHTLKDVVEFISKKEKISKKKVYDICLKLKND